MLLVSQLDNSSEAYVDWLNVFRVGRCCVLGQVVIVPNLQQAKVALKLKVLESFLVFHRLVQPVATELPFLAWSNSFNLATHDKITGRNQVEFLNQLFFEISIRPVCDLFRLLNQLCLTFPFVAIFTLLLRHRFALRCLCLAQLSQIRLSLRLSSSSSWIHDSLHR